MRIIVWGIVGLGIAGFAAYDQYDRSANYAAVQARVLRVNEQCYLEKKERGVFTKTTQSSRLMPCPLAEMLARDHPAWQGFDIKHKIEVSLLYVSPANGRQQEATMQLTSYPDGRAMRSGDVMAVRASKTEPARTRL
jgi:hypothetical protein